ncbi:Predicted oxidoreductase [Streptomyces qinglanensis]|uniref:Predicted oxidoreductase n=1 Tax=Streptomyces qinglanensis TaxID=943816 RepID=A0A1H9WXW9_9ACTN|nr:Predicted oxidoreductase [Streptomyces qinglanensis]
MARVAADLLPRFRVSTKVGYFPVPGRASEHSLDPERLRAAVERAARDLGREPDVVLLHNPEHSLSAGPEAERCERLAAACRVLEEAASSGVCGSWGISSWDPRPLGALAVRLPRPDVLMVRCGLLVRTEVLESAELLAAKLGPSQLWGMSPFGGGAADSVWERFDPGVFLREAERATVMQAAFRAACRLPEVDAVAVGTDNPVHLRELVGSLALEVDEEVVIRYRRLLQEAAGRSQDRQ